MIQVRFQGADLFAHCSSLQAAGVVLSGEFSFQLNAGAVHVLRGANGVGKSTLLRALANALPGQAFLFKPEYGLRDDMLVHDHLQIVLQHIPGSSASIEGLLDEVGLGDWQFERIATLSSGQRARLGLCTLLAGQFTVWLLDEPLNALDSQGCVLLARALQQHLNASGLVFMASHVDPHQVVQHMQQVNLHHHELTQGNFVTGNESVAVVQAQKPEGAIQRPCDRKIPLSALCKREWMLTLGNPQAVLWGALFHWMVLSFFGIGLGKPTVEFALVAVWISVLLSVLLGAKDWFAEDHRVGWMRFLMHLDRGNIAWYWLVRVLVTALAQTMVLMPVTGVVALQFGLNGDQAWHLMVALMAGIWAMAPLLGVVALMVMLTRGGAVLVYLFALPLLVPVLVFGLEASRAADFGRTATAPLAVLFTLGLLACLVGPSLARRLIQLIQE